LPTVRIRKKEEVINYINGFPVKLKEGEVFCSRCHGVGINNRINLKTLRGSVRQIICKKCFGEGKLTWLENIVGKKKDEQE